MAPRAQIPLAVLAGTSRLPTISDEELQQLALPAHQI